MKEALETCSKIFGGVGTAILVGVLGFAWWWVITTTRRLSKED